MRNSLIKSAILIVIVITTFQACKKEDKTPVNQFSYGNKTSLIGSIWGGYLGESPTHGVFGTTLFITENSLTWHYQGGYPDSLSGSGDLMMLTFITTELMEIPSGKYSYSSNSSAPFVANKFGMESFLIINYISATEEGEEVLFNGGTVDVVKNGEEYELTFNITTNVNTTITGYYKGKITMYDAGKKKSVPAGRYARPFLRQF